LVKILDYFSNNAILLYMNNENNQLTIILDTLGRTVLGQHNKEKSTSDITAITNPVILHVVDAGGGKMSIQLLPIFFREFLADKTGDVTFFYKNSVITSNDIDAIDFRLQAQYSQMFNKQNQFVTPQAQAAPQQAAPAQPHSVVNLFDE
jgi:hypothetical protein